MTGIGIGPKGMPEDKKPRSSPAREAQIANGGYGFGARVAALLGSKAPPETAAMVQRRAARHQSARLHAWREARARRRLQPRGVADKVTFPVLMISGSEDRVNPIDKNAAILIKALTQGRLEILEGFGHLPEVEAPDVVNRMSARLLRGIRRTEEAAMPRREPPIARPRSAAAR